MLLSEKMKEKYNAGYEVCQTKGFNRMGSMTGTALESYLSNKKFKVISQ
jgi:ribulose 1,5-bisphosphate synthetase/thiazole synthase